MVSPVDIPESTDVPDLFRGGIWYRVAHRFGVEPTSAARTARRAAALAAILWLPLVGLTLLDGTALPGRVAVPLVVDVAAWVRPLLVIPLLLVSQPVFATAIREAGRVLRERGLVAPDKEAAYAAAVDRTRRAANHVLPEVVALALAAGLLVRLLVAVLEQPRDTWFATAVGDGTSRLTLAGVWYACVVHLVLFFLTLRWIWLFFLWYRFLGSVSRLPLRLLPTHPDRAAGLGFLGRTLGATAPLAFAWSTALAATVANRMLHWGESLHDYIPLGIGHAVAVLLVFVLPLVAIFAPVLARTRRLALEEWGRHMARSGEALARVGPAPEGVGNEAEPKSLEEVQIAVEAVRGILPLPFPVSAVAGPLVATAIPVVPLLFIAFPAKEVLDRFAGLLF